MGINAAIYLNLRPQSQRPGDQLAIAGKFRQHQFYATASNLQKPLANDRGAHTLFPSSQRLPGVTDQPLTLHELGSSNQFHINCQQTSPTCKQLGNKKKMFRLPHNRWLPMVANWSLIRPV